MSINDDTNRVAIFFNGEYIGEADEIKLIKGGVEKMSAMNIEGDYHARDKP